VACGGRGFDESMIGLFFDFLETMCRLKRKFNAQFSFPSCMMVKDSAQLVLTQKGMEMINQHQRRSASQWQLKHCVPWT